MQRVLSRSKNLCWPLWLIGAPCPFKKSTAPFKETQLSAVWKENHLFERKVLLTKKKIESASSFEGYTMI
jgi:hypothetical protein